MPCLFSSSRKETALAVITLLILSVENLQQGWSRTGGNHNNIFIEEKARDMDTKRNETAYYRRRRNDSYYSWFVEPGGALKPDADSNGTILDFAIVGFAKCGTTSMEANLGNIAPLPISDVCTPLPNTVYYSFINWPTEYGRNKILRGTKCPSSIYNLKAYSRLMPRTLLVIGIRHPVLWFQSFWNMLARFHKQDYLGISPYNKTNKCGDRLCHFECPAGQLLCTQRGRFHLALARMGKTALSHAERQYLAWNDTDGGDDIENHGIRNPVFVYEVSELQHGDVWDDLANLLSVQGFPHDEVIAAPKTNTTGIINVKHPQIDICSEKYDEFRAIMMPIAHELAQWLIKYFVPVADDARRTDVHITNPQRFRDIVQGYSKDPCGKLHRLENGIYALTK